MIFDQPEYTLKTILIGDSKVGKTSFLKLLQNSVNKKTVTTIGVDFASLYYNINDTSVKINVWDTAGQDRFVNIVRSYFRSICSIILMFDVSKPESLINLEKWMQLIEYENSCSHKHPILLIGNKTDLGNKVDEFQLNSFINKYNKYNVIYREISCKKSSPSEELMATLISNVLNSINNYECNGIITHGSIHNSFSLTYNKDDDNENDNDKDNTQYRCCRMS